MFFGVALYSTRTPILYIVFTVYVITLYVALVSAAVVAAAAGCQLFEAAPLLFAAAVGSQAGPFCCGLH